MVRKTAPAPRWWLNALTRNRASPGELEREVHLEVLLRSPLRWASFMMPVTRGSRTAASIEPRPLDAPQVAVDPHYRRKPGREMQVGRGVVHREFEQFADVHSSVLSPVNAAMTGECPPPDTLLRTRQGGIVRSARGFGNSPKARLM